MALVKSEKRLIAYRNEFNIARTFYAARTFDKAFYHLERAHILGQPWPLLHTRAHWEMLKIGFKRKDKREIFGQIIRLSGGGLLSLLGRLPNGNTGGANVPAEQPMQIPADLKPFCE